MKTILKLANFINRYFIIWVILFSLWGGMHPNAFLFLKKYVGLLLGLVMLGMGLTLDSSDFKRIFVRPRLITIGLFCQFTVMPLAAFFIAKLLHFSSFLTAGMVLLGSCPGGTASNVISYLAGADVALSVSLTTFSTLLSPLLTPFLMYILVRKIVPVDFLAMFINILKIVIIPVFLGVILRSLFRKNIVSWEKIFPAVSVLSIAVIIAVVVASNRQDLLCLNPLILLGVALHNLSGLSVGYGLAKLFRLNKAGARTIAIEVGMQNSGLAVVLALRHLSSLAAVPASIFSIFHNISGSLLASYWQKRK